MKDVPLSNLETAFVLSALGEGRRMDGRAPYDVRHVDISFGSDFGCAQTRLGDTRVMAQVSCKMNVPKDARPAEGLMRINVELSPMAAPEFEGMRPNSDLFVEISRILERLIKESKCVDLEALCIISGEKVWDICVDIHVLNHDGNLIDAASICAMAALLHFRRPDVSVSGNEVTIHSFDDKAPISLSVHHIPICTTFAFMEGGKQMVVDPTDLEERTMDGKVVVGINVHQEICCLQMAGKLLLEKDQVIRCTNIALVKVTAITQQIKARLAEDNERRSKNNPIGFAADLHRAKSRLTSEKDSLELDLKKARQDADDMLEAWRKENAEPDEEEGEDDDEEEEEDGEEDSNDDEDSSSEEEESETDSDEAPTNSALNGVGNPTSTAAASSSSSSTATASISLNAGSTMRFGEGGPSQWTTDEKSKTKTKDKEDGENESSDSEEEEAVQLTTSDTR